MCLSHISPAWCFVSSLLPYFKQYCWRESSPSLKKYRFCAALCWIWIKYFLQLNFSRFKAEAVELLASSRTISSKLEFQAKWWQFQKLLEVRGNGIYLFIHLFVFISFFLGYHHPESLKSGRENHLHCCRYTANSSSSRFNVSFTMVLFI